jgi:hypothetical protein
VTCQLHLHRDARRKVRGSCGAPTRHGLVATRVWKCPSADPLLS